MDYTDEQIAQIINTFLNTAVAKRYKYCYSTDKYKTLVLLFVIVTT